MRAIVYQKAGCVRLEERPIPQIRPGWTLIRVANAGICGSDMTILAGKHPRAKAPLILGHEFSGFVASPHPSLPEGTLVSVYPHISCNVCNACRRGLYYSCETLRILGIDLDGGMAEFSLVPQDALYAVLHGMTPQMAAFIEPISIGVHAARKALYQPGDSVLLFGAGGIGLSCALTLRRFGADRILLCEPDAGRCALARKMGFDVIPCDARLADEIAERFPLGADLVVDCAGHPSVASLLPDVVRIGGRILIVAGYKEPPSMNFQKGMMREFSIAFTRNSARDDFETAIRLASIEPHYAELLNCILPSDRAQEGFAKPEGALKVMFEF